jgi:DNA-binding transcriptional LysR family regulator
VDIRAVDYMLAVAEHGSLRAAAQAVGVTQPALTKAIRRIEDEAGAPLFHRTARGVHPTVYGEAMLRHARNLRVSLRSATVEIAALKAGTAGVVRIGAGPSWERAILPEAIAAFRAHRPDVRILVLGGTDDFLKLRLRDGLLDLVLAATPDAPALDPDLEWQPLMTDEYCVIAARSHPLRRRHGIALEDLLPYPWILPGAHSLMVERLRIIFRAHALPAPESRRWKPMLSRYATSFWPRVRISVSAPRDFCWSSPIAPSSGWTCPMRYGGEVPASSPAAAWSQTPPPRP